MTPINIVNVSGGVDSTACYLLALEEREKTGQDFRAVFADTGNEHQITIDYVNSLAEKTGGPKIQTVKADFAQRIAAKRIKLEMMLETGCFKEGWNEENVKRVLENLHPTGVPFLDMCMWKGRFPSTMVRFCTQELKLEAIKLGATEPAICEMIAKGGQPSDVINWVGIRRDESKARANAQMWDTESNGSRVYRPLVEWTKAACFDLLHKHGVDVNPLYKLGCGRVGCMPCIMARKAEIREMVARFPEHVDKLREWERIMSLCSKGGKSTFFQADTIPGEGDTRADIDSVVEWSKTGRGGMQYCMEALMEPPACSSLYGLCE